MPFLSFLRANAPFLFAGFLLSFLSGFGQTYFISVFAAEIRALNGLGHGEWGALYAACTMASAFVMLWSGALTDRFRVRHLGSAVLALLALACLLMATGPTGWLLPLGIFALRLFGQGMVVQTAGVAMARWFVASRGRALAVAALGFSVGEVVMPLGFVWLKSLLHWQGLWLVAALIIAASLPVIWRLLRLERTPQSIAAENDAPGMGNRHWTRGQMLRHPLFWCVLPALIGPPCFITAFFFQQVHLAEVKGWSHLGLVATFPAYTAASVTAMFAGGWALDRWGTARLMPVYVLPLGLFFMLFPMIDSLSLAAPAMLIMGLTSGAQTTIPMAFWAEFYGTRHLGAIRATVASAMVLATAIGPALSGLLIDRGHSLPDQMPAYAGWFVLAAALLFWRIRSDRAALPARRQARA
ncbi:MFS transporter [Rhodobacter sp. HX-7-19]|uniref:MFS transporter n=1 Tax=Paragemmobacter kunshanensis TaxID=2583234 RepID=A0A6M1TSY8_9RHOB|nr:MFS transporter [Rhodobacter kunshanensis]NGQ91140.1 MFS transporter [Rhodobacter kunshanensis]